MTEDNKRLITIEGDFKDMKEDFNGVKEDISIIKSALVGNELSGDKGMVGKVDRLEEELAILTEDRVRNSIYISQLSWAIKAIATVVTALLVAVIKTYFDK